MPVGSRARVVAISRNLLRPGPAQTTIHGYGRRALSDSQPPAFETAVEDSEGTGPIETNNVPPDDSSSNWERNDFIRKAFTEPDPEHVDRLLPSPFAAPKRTYPTVKAQKRHDFEARVSAKTQAGLQTLWGQQKNDNHYVVKRLDYVDMIRLLKEMTPPTSGESKRNLSAMRIVLPPSWDLNISKQDVDYVNSHTGLVDKLRAYRDHGNASAVIVRGRRQALAKAADELLAINERIQVYELGEVSSCDYLTRQLWPTIQPALEGDGEDVQEDSLWVHNETNNYWVETKYEDVPRPEEWTPGSFEEYIKKLVYGRIRTHLVMPLYNPTRDPKVGDFALDPDGIRIGLIMNAFKDPEARSSITAPVLKLALAFMSPRGGHYTEAIELFRLAEDWGLPMDTELFNVMLDGVIVRSDHRSFYKVLRTMKAGFFHANARTWLLFLQLVQKDDIRREVVVAMYNMKMMTDPAVCTAVAGTMASLDANTAMRSGRTLDEFLDEQKLRYDIKYDAGWLSYEDLNRILSEFFLLKGHLKPSPQSYAGLLRMGPNGPREMDISTLNLLLDYGAMFQHWEAVFDALRLMEKYGLEPNWDSYIYLLRLAAETSSPHALGAITFLGAHQYQLQHKARMLLRTVFVGRHRNKYWFHNKVPLLTSEMALSLQGLRRTTPQAAVSRAIRAIAFKTEGLKPLESLPDIIQAAHLLDCELKADGSPKPLEIKMRNVANETELSPSSPVDQEAATAPPHITTFRLENHLDPATLVAKWVPRDPNRKRGEQELAELVPDWASFQSSVSQIVKGCDMPDQKAKSKEA